MGTLSDSVKSPEQLLLDCVLASDTLRRAPKLKALLAYLAEHSFRHHPEALTEQQVGMSVFGRAAGYNASEDSVVRVQVRNLRERLANYFANEGASEPLVLVIPKGRYRLEFCGRGEAPIAETDARPAAQPAPSTSRWWTKPAWAAALAAMVTAPVAIIVYSYATANVARSVAANPILDSLFSPGKNTLVVCEDMAMVMAYFLRGRPMPLAEYSALGARTLDLQGELTNDLSRQRMEYLIANGRVINQGNATFSTRLWRSFPHLAERALFKHARDLQLREMRAAHTILFGAQPSNPWVDLYEESLNFQLEPLVLRNTRRPFGNRHPEPGEKTRYGDAQDGDTRTYARIALLPNFEGKTRTLILTGMSGAETEAAASFLLAPDFTDRLPAPLRSRLNPIPEYVEILLGTHRVGPEIGKTEVVAWRTSFGALQN